MRKSEEKIRIQKTEDRDWKVEIGMRKSEKTKRVNREKIER